MRPGRCTLVCVALVTGCAPGAAPQATTQDPDSTHAAAAAEHAMSGMSMPTVVEDLHMKLTPERRAAPGDSTRAAALVTRVRGTLAKYPDVRVAEADGFHLILPGVKHQPVYHYTNRLYALEAMVPFDPYPPTWGWRRCRTDGAGRGGAGSHGGGDVLHRFGRAVRTGRAGGDGRAGRGPAAALCHAAAVQRSRDIVDRRARLDVARRGRLLPVGEARIRTGLGVLERVALLGLLADRHGDLPGVVPAVSAFLPAGVVALRGVGPRPAADLGRHVAQSPGHSRGGHRVRMAPHCGAGAIRHPGSRRPCAVARRRRGVDARTVPRAGDVIRGRAGRRHLTAHLELQRLG